MNLIKTLQVLRYHTTSSKNTWMKKAYLVSPSDIHSVVNWVGRRSDWRSSSGSRIQHSRRSSLRGASSYARGGAWGWLVQGRCYLHMKTIYNTYSLLNVTQHLVGRGKPCQDSLCLPTSRYTASLTMSCNL